MPGGRLLVARLSALGDVVHTLPAVNALADARPDLEIGWVVEAPYAPLVEKVGRVHEVIPVQMKQWPSGIFSSGTRERILASVRRARELVDGGAFVDFQGLMKSAVWGLLSRAATRIGFGPGVIRERLALPMLTDRAPVNDEGHVVEINTRLASFVAGRQLAPAELDFASFEEAPDGELAAMMERNPYVLLPATGRFEKNWPTSSWGRLADQLERATGVPSLAVWGPGEREIARKVAAESSSVTVARPTTIPQLVWLLARARVVVGGDTGPLHIAAALGTRTVGIYGPTDPRRNGPRGPRTGTVGGFGRRMEGIGVEEAFGMVQRLS